MSYSYIRANSIASAEKALADAEGTARLLAGGTDLMVQIKRGLEVTGQVIDLRHIGNLQGIAIGNGEIVIGACARHREIEQNRYFQSRIHALCESSRVVGGIQIRNIGTAGGNLVNASPAADLNPVLMALDATVVFRDQEREHTSQLRNFITGPSQTVLSPSGIVTAIRIADPPIGTGTAFLKAGRRRAMEIALVNVAVRLRLKGERISEARIVLGAVGPTMLRAEAAENLLTNAVLNDDVMIEAARLASAASQPRDDIRASSKYRGHLVGVLVRRAILAAHERATKDAIS